MSNIAGATTFKIRNTKSYVSVVTLSTKDSVKLTKQLSEGTKRPLYPKEYKRTIESKDLNDQNLTIFFVLAFHNTNKEGNKVKRNSHRKHFLPRVNITKYNVLIDDINFFDQAFNDQIKKYKDIRKFVTGQGEDYKTGCLLDYQYYFCLDSSIVVVKCT